MKASTIALTLAALIAAPAAWTQTAQETFDENMRNAQEVHARQQAEADREAMRDTSHDGRLSVDNGVSVGGNVRDDGTVEANVKVDLERDD